MVTLGDVNRDERFELVTVPDEKTEARLLRLGLRDGVVECCQQLRGGPTVVRRNGTRVAVGAALANRIEVERVGHRRQR